MRLHRCASYEEMSRRCAQSIEDFVKDKPDASIVLATGYSPRLSYRMFVQKALESNLDVGQVTWIKLDEWLGIPADDASTCEHFLQAEVLKPLLIASDRYIAFDSMCQDVAGECARIGKQVQAAGGIDLAILGIGKNGHLGLNEPGETQRISPHAADLSEQTLRHEMLMHAAHTPKWGITLGLGDIFSARKVILLAAGDGKQESLAVALSGQVTTKVPVSLLQLHPCCECITDR